MKLEIYDIGRVERAEIELPGITVVAGENGSGKSTISKSLYIALESFYNPMQKAEAQRRRSESNLIGDWLSGGIYKNSGTGKIKKRIRDLFYSATGNEEHFVEEVVLLMQENMPEMFFDRKRMTERVRQLFYEYMQIVEKNPNYYIRYASQTVIDGVFQKQINCLKGMQEGYIVYHSDEESYKIRVYRNKIEDMTATYYDTEGMRPIYITTSDLMDSLDDYRRLRSAEKYGTVSYANSQLTKLLMEEIRTGELVAEEYQKLETQKLLLEEILEQVLEGEIYLDNNHLTYHDKWCDSNIEFCNIASGMKIFLILKRLISNGVFLKPTCLIMDEPETNLHPEWQLILAHLLVLLSLKMQVKIYLNSHSPYFVRAIEYYSNEYQVLDGCKFYMMQRQESTELFGSEDVTQKLGAIYDKLAEPFNQIM